MTVEFVRAQNTNDAIGLNSVENILELLKIIERLNRLRFDIIKEEIEWVKHLDITAVQALLLFNIGCDEVSVGELKTRGHCRDANVSYNLKRLGNLGYVHFRKCGFDRRLARVRLTAKGQKVRGTLARLFERHTHSMVHGVRLGAIDFPKLVEGLTNLAWFWRGQIRRSC